MSRQGCRTLARYTAAELRDVDRERCEQPADGRVYKWHNGLDIGAPEGTPIVMPAPGRIVRAYQLAGYYDPAVDRGSGGYGRSILVELWPGCALFAAHCAAVRSDVGAIVQIGETIGTVGRTCGNENDPACQFSSGPHLHLEFVNRWPLASSDVDARYDVIGTLENLGIDLAGDGRFYWRDARRVEAPPAPAEGPFPAEGIEPGAAFLYPAETSEAGRIVETIEQRRDFGALVVAAAGLLWWQKRRARP